MFKKQLSEKLFNIFKCKVTFSNPSESKEHDTMFVEIEKCKSNYSDQRVNSVIYGSVRLFSDNKKLSYGFFHEKINLASKQDTENIFFHEIDNNVSYQNEVGLTERKAKFIFIFRDDFNNNTNIINELKISESES